MKKTVYLFLMLLSLALLSNCTHVTFSSPLVKTTGELPNLIAPGGQTLKLEIVDNRPAPEIYGGGLALIDSGVFIAYGVDPNISLGQYLEKTAAETCKTLGTDVGSGAATLKITVSEFWIDMYRFSGWSPMNCIGYGSLTIDSRKDGAPVSPTRSYKVAYYENTTPAWSMDEVAREAMSRIYSQAIWETLGKTLLETRSPVLDPNGLEKLLQMIETETDDRAAREMIFWLGLVGRDDPKVKEKLLQIFRNTREQRRRQAAVEAVGMLGIQEARQDIVDILAGTRKVGYWSNDDAEEVFYLIKALANLGENNLQEYIPKQDFRARKKVEDLVGFLNTGKIPELHPNAKPLFEEVKAEAKKKN
ncbi:MAG: HEAT repeat domain-containing protein [Deltaproteobacteria bacterium]|nr:HEAT repeat domain-containing protein [Deltaproteobacteria bacterium]